MFRLSPAAWTLLAPETQLVAEHFLGGLPPFARTQIRRIRLYGPHARGWEPEAPFALLVEVDRRSIEVRTALSIATSAVESEGMVTLDLSLVTPFDLHSATGPLARLILNAEREGLDIWHREEEEDVRGLLH